MQKRTQKPEHCIQTRLHVASPCPCLSLSKFNIDDNGDGPSGLTDRLGSEPNLSVKRSVTSVNLMVAVMETGTDKVRVNGP